MINYLSVCEPKVTLERMFIVLTRIRNIICQSGVFDRKHCDSTLLAAGTRTRDGVCNLTDRDLQSHS